MKKGIYIIRNKVSGKVYIGQSIMLNRRFSGHLYRIFRNEHHNEILQRAFNKYGAENFEYNILEEVKDESSLNEREKYWIDFYGGINSENVYNLKDPLINEWSDYLKNKKSRAIQGKNNPNYGHKWTDEMKKKESERRKGKTWEELYGKEKAEKAKLKMSESNKGRIHSEETKEKIRQHNIGEKNPAYGKGDRQRGEKNPMFGKPALHRKSVIQIDKEGNIIREYEFLSQVKKYGFNPGNVCSVLKGKQETSGGFIWKYKDGGSF